MALRLYDLGASYDAINNMKTSLMQSKKVLSYGAIVIAAAVLLTAAVSSEVLAQTTTTNSTASKNAITASTTASPLFNITGSIPLGPTISGAISSKAKTNLSDAVTIAQKAVGTNTSATLA